MSSQSDSVLDIGDHNDLWRPAIALSLSLVLHGVLALSIASKNRHDVDDDGTAIHAGMVKRIEVQLTSPDLVQIDRKKEIAPLQAGSRPHLNNLPGGARHLPIGRMQLPIEIKTIDLLTYYHHIDELTTPPIVQDNVEPSTTLTLTMEEVPDHPLQLRLSVNENGDIDDIEIEDSKLSIEATRIVKEQFLKMKFMPGMIKDLAVKSQFVIEVSLGAAARPPELNSSFIELSRKVLISK